MSVLSDIAEEEYKMEMTPMIDVVFLLLIFFLCTIKFKVLEGKLSAYLPKDVGVNQFEAEPKEKIEITIKIKKEGQRVYASGKERGQPWGGESSRRFEFENREQIYSIGPRKTDEVDKIGKWLEDLFKKDPERPSTIDCRPGTVYGDMVPVLDAAVEAGFTDITFIGEYKKAAKK